MDPTALPLPSNLPSTEAWRADLETWHDKYVLVDPSGLLFFETERREYVVSPVPLVRRSPRCPITSENTANSGRPSEVSRRKSIAPLLNGTSSLLHIKTESSKVPSNELDHLNGSNAKRRKVDVYGKSRSLSAVQQQQPPTSPVVTISSPNMVTQKYNWRRQRKSTVSDHTAETAEVSTTCESSPSENIRSFSGSKDSATGTRLSTRACRKRGSDSFDLKDVTQEELVGKSAVSSDSLRRKSPVSSSTSTVCCICNNPHLRVDGWHGRFHGKPCCRPCGRFVENMLIYKMPAQPLSCVSGLRDCVIDYKSPLVCRFCRLRKCVSAWSVDNLPVPSKLISDSKKKSQFLKSRNVLLKSVSLPVIKAKNKLRDVAATRKQSQSPKFGKPSVLKAQPTIDSLPQSVPDTVKTLDVSSSQLGVVEVKQRIRRRSGELVSFCETVEDLTQVDSSEKAVPSQQANMSEPLVVNCISQASPNKSKRVLQKESPRSTELNLRSRSPRKMSESLSEVVPDVSHEPSTRRSSRPGRGSKMSDLLDRVKSTGIMNVRNVKRGMDRPPLPRISIKLKVPPKSTESPSLVKVGATGPNVICSPGSDLTISSPAKTSLSEQPELTMPPSCSPEHPAFAVETSLVDKIVRPISPDLFCSPIKETAPDSILVTEVQCQSIQNVQPFPVRCSSSDGSQLIQLPPSPAKLLPPEPPEASQIPTGTAVKKRKGRGRGRSKPQEANCSVETEKITDAVHPPPPASEVNFENIANSDAGAPDLSDKKRAEAEVDDIPPNTANTERSETEQQSKSSAGVTLPPRAAALAATAALRTQHASVEQRRSLSPRKSPTKELSKSPVVSFQSKRRRTVGTFQREQLVSVASLKSVKLKGKDSDKKKKNCNIDNKKTPPRRSSSERRSSILDSPEYVPPITDELKASINRLKNETGDKRPRIKHVFRQPSSTFLPLSRPPSAAGSPPSVGSACALSSTKSSVALSATNDRQNQHRSPTPPPPLRAPIRISVNKSTTKSISDLSAGSKLCNENKKSKRPSNFISPTRSNQQLIATRCNRCPGCKLADCGKCKFCRDMPKFGGPGRLRGACEKRVCGFQDRLREFTYRRIKLPTIQLPDDVLVPICALKEVDGDKRVTSSKTETSPAKQLDPANAPLTPPHNNILNSPTNCGSPAPEVARRSSLCSNGLNCVSPVPYSVVQSPVHEEVVVSTETKTEDIARREDITDSSALEELDVSSLKPILSEFEPLPPLRKSSDTRRRRVCAALLEDISLERAFNEGIAVVTTASLMPAIRALCLLCGSAGLEPMMFCQLCAHPFHKFCLALLDEDSKEDGKEDEKEDAKPAAEAKEDPSKWLCPSCQYCELCTQPSASNNRLARCTRCQFHFHPSCLAPNYPVPKKKTKSIWVCSRCVKCENCGATHPGRGLNAQWSADFKLCQSCSDAQGQNFCPECNKAYGADDYTLRMLQCNRCDAWIHATPCAGLTDDLYDLFEFLPDSVHFMCFKCARKISLQRPLIWEVRVQRLLADRLGEVLAAFVQHIQSVAGDISDEGDVDDDTLQCHMAIAAMEDENQKEIMQDMCELLVKASYRDISSFILDFWNVVKVRDVKIAWLADTLLGSFNSMNPAFKKRVKSETLEKIEKKNEPPKAVKSKKSKEQQPAEKKKQKASGNKRTATVRLNTTSINRNSEDTRMCRLCCRFGDSDSQDAGRLLYAGQDDWIHVNCALWSAEVFERGSLLCNVTQALARSRHIKCHYCGRNGATLQCREQGCRMDFHFMCARENGHIFTEDHHSYCPEHSVDDSDEDSDDEMGYISEFSVDRRLICDPDGIRWRRSWLDGFNSQDVTIVIGSLTILRLGTICELSDVKHVLIPWQFAVERVHWDVDDPTRLRVYRCVVDAVQSPNFENLNNVATTVAIPTPIPRTPKASHALPADSNADEVFSPILKTPSIMTCHQQTTDCSPSKPELEPRSDSIVPQPPLPEPTPSPVETSGGHEFPSPKKLSTNAATLDDDVPTNKWPIATWVGISPAKISDGAVFYKQPTPTNTSPVKSSPVKGLGDSMALNRIRRLIDVSPQQSDHHALMRAVQCDASMNRPPCIVQPFASPLSPKKSSENSLSRNVPFAHQKPQQPPNMSIRLLSPNRSVRPNIPSTEISSDSGGLSVTGLASTSSGVAVNNSQVTSQNNGLVQVSSTLDPEVLSTVDLVVSRLAFASGDFSRHGASLVPQYATPHATTINLLRTAAGISGKRIPPSSFNATYSSVMWEKYRLRTKSGRPCQKPIFPGPMGNSIPIIVNQQSLMPTTRPPELDLFPVSIFPAPRFGTRAKRHSDAMSQALETVQQEKEVEEASHATVEKEPRHLVQSQVPAVNRPLILQVVNARNPTGTTVMRQIPIARLQLVSQSSQANATVPQPRIVSLRAIRPTFQAVAPLQMPSGFRPPPLVAGGMNQPSGAMQPGVLATVRQGPRMRFPVPNAGQSFVVANPSGSITQLVPDVQIPVKKVATFQQAQMQITPPFLNVALPPISPVPLPQDQQNLRFSRLVSFGHISPTGVVTASPTKVTFQVSPQACQKGSPEKPVVDRSSSSAEADEKKPQSDQKPVHKRKDSLQKRHLLNDDLLLNDTAKPASINNTKSSGVQKVVAKRPKTPLSLATLLPKSPLKACLPTTELALAEIVNRVVTESVLFDRPDGQVQRHRKQQRYLVFDIMPLQSAPAAEQRDSWKIRAFTWQDSWRVFFSRLSAARRDRGLTELCYDSLSGLALLGLTQNSVVALIEQLPGVEDETTAYSFRFARYERIAPNPSGCARSQPWTKWTPTQRRHRDVFAFLMSSLRKPKVRGSSDNDSQEQLTSMTTAPGGLVSWEVSRPHKTLRRPTTLFDLPLPTRLRYLRETARYDVGVFRSTIHARGLYALRDFEAQEMIIEYAGEIIRATLTDKRERMYERQGIGCYMFRLDDTTVIDATRCGNAGRFINHCCEPNCYSRVIVGYEGLKHIVIFASRPIAAGEELTYDYKFPLEDAASKIPCYCGARRCRKYLN